MQTKAHSFLEANANWIVGLPTTYLAYMYLVPLLGVRMPAGSSVKMTVLFTLISIARSFILRRAFNRWTVHKLRKRIMV